MVFDRRFALGSLSAATVAGTMIATLAVGAAMPPTPAFAQSSRPQMTPDQRNTAEYLEGAFEKIADTVSPATVFITAKVDAPAGNAMMPFGGDDGSPFGQLFGPSSPFGRRNGPSTPRRTMQSSGSGVIVRPDGYVLTNDHVVEGARNGEVTVQLADGTTYDHCKVFRDQRSDLAVVKITASKPLPYVSFGDSSRLRVGQWAVAIGAPFGEANSMTAGIVSALNRKTTIGQGEDARYYPTLIQTDASINPGNSGGPLLNINGQLIGINVAIESPSGTSAGIGFAIPADTAKAIMEQLISSGKVVRGSLGIVPDDIPVGLRQKLGTDKGAYVRMVPADGPADKAGIQPGDVITRIGDKTVTNEVTLRDAIAVSPPGTKVPITLLRDGKSVTVTATLDSLDKQVASASPTGNTAGKPANDLGFDPRTLTPEMASSSQIPLDPSTKGVVVMNVAPGSPASEAGLQVGNVITAVNGTPVTTVATMNTAIQRVKSGDPLTLTVLIYDNNSSKWDRAVINIVVP